MNWIQLSIIHSFIAVSLILYIRYDNTPYYIFPIIINIIVGLLSIIYFLFYYNEHFTEEFVKPKYYIFSLAVLAITLLGYYIIKVCPNPAYFRTFAALEIILLLLFSIIYLQKHHYISTQTIIGILCCCAGIILISLDDDNNV